MTMKPFKELMPREEAIEIILENIRPIIITEKLTLQNTVGRVLANDIIAEFDVPPFDRASMDGYAVKAADTYEASEDNHVRLKLIGSQQTGEMFDGEIAEGECIEIGTGSPMPLGSDAVVMVEYTELDGNYVMIKKKVSPGRNMAPAGEDIVKGTRVLKSGCTVTPGVLGTLAALGFIEVEVYMKPKVAIYSSGPEIIPQGVNLKPGQIYDINSFTLAAVIELNGGEPYKRGVMKDNENSIKKNLKDASRFDLAVFSGGSSVGAKDLFGEIVNDMGKVYFHGVKTKPGKPTLFGKIENTCVFGMPGYPTSCLNNSYIYLIPALRKMARLEPKYWVSIEVPMGECFESKSDREQFVTVQIRDGKAYKVYKESGDITSMTYADGFIILPIEKSKVKEGERVRVTLLNV